MGLLSLEHSKTAYMADLLLYGVAVLALATALLWAAPPAQSLAILMSVGAGLVAWTAVEYGVHRFILHGVPPFRRWHADHHARPAALLGAPTLLSATLLAMLLGPAWAWVAPWPAAGLTLGLLAGYLGYALTHHAIHHSRARDNAWLKRRKVWHARHHLDTGSGFYGVTSRFWDQSCGTAQRASRPSPALPHDLPPCDRPSS